jgi:hypothetical protein
MPIEQILLAALVERFGDRPFCMGSTSGPLVTFAAAHTDVGDVRIARPIVGSSSIGEILYVEVAIGGIISNEFENFDSHLDMNQRAARLTGDVVRFLQELFADRLLFWKATDGRNAAWRECANAVTVEPLVSDARTYRMYLWSGPLGEWRAIPGIFARRRIRDEREYQILSTLMAVTGPDALQGTERDLGLRLIADYDRGHAV